MGTCTVTITSPTAGTVSIHATTTFSVGGVSLTRATGASHTGDGSDVTKVFVVANISRPPLSTLFPYTTLFRSTATVLQNAGLGAGFVAAPNGTLVTEIGRASCRERARIVGGNTCTISNGLGTCTVTITSPTAGTVSIHATTTFSVGGVSVTRATGDSHTCDGRDVTKVFVDANIAHGPGQ